MTVPRIVTIIVVIYLLGYLALRTMLSEVWEKDGRTYVIFPKEPPQLYYLYRPLSIIDEKLTGMGTHIGPHAENDQSS